MLTIVGIVEVRVRHDGPGAWRVNEAAIARVDSHVIHATRGGTEKHEVSGGQRFRLDAAGGAPLIRGGAWHFDAEAIKAVEHQAAAIEAARIIAAELVGRADEARRYPNELFAGAARHVRGSPIADSFATLRRR